MHSSRMLTTRCSGHLLGGGGGYLHGSVCPEGGVCLGVSARHPPWTEWQTGIKTLPCRNYVADGNNGNRFWTTKPIFMHLISTNAKFRFNIHYLPQFQGTNTALAAVALQDHLMRNLSLRDPLLLNRQKAPQPKTKQWRKNARPTVDTGRGKLYLRWVIETTQGHLYCMKIRPNFIHLYPS